MTLFICIIIPLVISNIAHMLIVKFNLFAILSIPISRQYFGKNKTWRGFISLSVLNSFVMGFFCLFFPSESILSPFVAGLLFGLVYMLFELPNSFLKRKMNIAPGESAPSHKKLFQLLDKSDSGLGVTLLAFWLFKLSLGEAFILFITSVIIHVAFSVLLLKTNIKESF
jgi:hypothetical protein